MDIWKRQEIIDFLVDRGGFILWERDLKKMKNLEIW